MKRGFTLIELLAVIVILAIIALIAIPITANIVDETRLSAKQRSAEFYVDAIDLAMVDYLRYNGELEDGIYTLRQLNEILKIDVNEDGISFTEDSYFYIKDSKVKTYNFITSKGENITSVKSTDDSTGGDNSGSSTGGDNSGSSTGEENLNVVSCNVNNKCYYATSKNPVYLDFDPVNGEKCSSESDSTTCYKWIVFAYNNAHFKDATTIELISTKNLIESSAWINEVDYGCKGRTCPRTYKGPLTILKNLKEFTKDWKIPSQNYVYRNISGNSAKPSPIVPSEETGGYNDFYYMSKARIINRYEFNSLWDLRFSLFELSEDAFWTATTSGTKYAIVQLVTDNTTIPKTISASGQNVYDIKTVSTNIPIGIRPVITLPASILSE